MRRHTTALVLLAAVLLLPAPPAAADWNDQLQKAEAHLAEDRSAQALQITRRLTDRVVKRLAPDDAAARALGSVLAVRAMAEAAEGLEDDARFHWSLAKHFRPDVVRSSGMGSDGAGYGEGGRLLAAWEAADQERAAEVREAEAEEPAADAETEVQAPRKLVTPPPQFRSAISADRIQGRIALQAVIDETGRVTEVEIVDGLHPGLDYRAAEAVRAWRFEPARRDGRAVAVYYQLQFHVDLPGRF